MRGKVEVGSGNSEVGMWKAKKKKVRGKVEVGRRNAEVEKRNDSILDIG